MKSVKTFSLLLCTLLLTACGGSSNNGASATSTPASSEQAQPTPGNASVVVSPTPPAVTPTPPAATPPAVTPTPPAATPPAVAPMPPVVTPPAVAPIPPVVIPSTDREIFNRLSSENFGSQDWLTITLEGAKIVLAPRAKTDVADKALTTLRGSDGKLVGYAGYLSGTQTEENPLRPDDPTVERKAFALLGVDPQQLTLPTASYTYEGVMNYFYENQANIYTAGVTATYAANTKQVEMTISGRDADRSRVWTLSTPAEPEGKVSGSLIENRQRSGQFVGGFYGKDGKFLVGETQFEDTNNKDRSWKGVVHTTVK